MRILREFEIEGMRQVVVISLLKKNANMAFDAISYKC